ncbi:MAG: UbiD family decarboxylase domain-containing protein [Candidatus Bathyarchaeia archaeon]
MKDSPVKEVVERPRLSRIPVPTHFEKNAGQFITSATIFAHSPDKKVENLSIHRLQVLDDKHLAIRLVPRHLYKLWSMAKEAGQDLEVAISIGLPREVEIWKAVANTVPKVKAVNLTFGGCG